MWVDAHPIVTPSFSTHWRMVATSCCGCYCSSGPNCIPLTDYYHHVDLEITKTCKSCKTPLSCYSLCTLSSVTGSGHVKNNYGNITRQNRTQSDMLDNWVFSINLKKHAKWSYKSKTREWPCILHGHSLPHYWECTKWAHAWQWSCHIQNKDTWLF